MFLFSLVRVRLFYIFNQLFLNHCTWVFASEPTGLLFPPVFCSLLLVVSRLLSDYTEALLSMSDSVLILFLKK